MDNRFSDARLYMEKRKFQAEENHDGPVNTGDIPAQDARL